MDVHAAYAGDKCVLPKHGLVPGRPHQDVGVLGTLGLDEPEVARIDLVIGVEDDDGRAASCHQEVWPDVGGRHDGAQRRSGLHRPNGHLRRCLKAVGEPLRPSRSPVLGEEAV